MNKLYLKLNNDAYDQVVSFSTEKNSDLNLLIISFNPMCDWISIFEKDKKIYIWVDYLEKEYDDWKDIPKLELSQENYTKIIEQWNNNLENPASYLALSQNDTGWINLEGKQELSQDDLDYIEMENKQK